MLKYLGEKSEIPQEVNRDTLDVILNPHPDVDYQITLDCPEFTSLCPRTGQPDHGTVEITYNPDKVIVETKSLKLYLFSYRNHKGFCEENIGKIFKDLRDKLDPNCLIVECHYTPRGGIALNSRFSYSNYRRKES